jgi:Pentapeptide repeats (8 copies)
MSEQQTTTSACPHPEAVGQRWGDPISEQRQAELQGYLDRWAAETDHGERRGPFDEAQLTGAEVFWLAGRVRTAYGSVPELRLEGADLRNAHLEGAILNGASLDKTSRLNDAVLADASFDQVTFDNTNLTVVDWSLVDILGDERTACERKGSDGTRKDRAERLHDYKAAVRAYRVLAVALQTQGLSEDAARFAYRAQVESEDKTARWIGSDALRELTSAAILARLKD